VASKQPAIVAELGRPETPEETAARRAENSRKHRANQSLVNLIGALLATLAVVLVIVLVVVRPSQPPAAPVDYASVAAEAQGGVDAPLIVPRLPDGWAANDARLDTVSGVDTWHIGFVTPAQQFIAVDQGIDGNPSWQSTLLQNRPQTGKTTIDGVTWQVFDNRTADQPGNVAYALATTAGSSTVLLYGTADDTEFETIATAISADVLALGEATP
jgi:hypothetical protein